MPSDSNRLVWRARRRELLEGAGLLLGALVLGRRAQAQDPPAFALPADARSALEKAPLVYISPLKSNGAESRCHGEVWYFVDGGDVVIGTSPERWKGRAVKRGLDRARLWVPKGSGDFRAGYTFVGRASVDADAGTFDRLLARYADKYPEEWGTWGPRFEKGRKDGTRVLIRYRPVAA
jgi:hypothetical protein